MVATVAVVAAQRPDGPLTVRDAAVAAPDRDAVAALAERSAPGGTPVVDEPRCLTVHDCFAWVAEVPSASDWPPAIVAHGVVVTATGGLLQAHDLDDGTVAWRARIDVARPRHQGFLVPAGELLLHLDTDGALIARDLDDGQVRWTNAELGVFSLAAARADGDVLRVAYETHHRSAWAGLPPGSVGTLDAASGASLWQLDGVAPMLTRDGAVITTDEGGLRAVGRDGEPRWETGPVYDPATGGAWSVGPLVAVHDGLTPAPDLYRVSDGSRVEELRGDVLSHDDDAALILARPPDPPGLHLWEDDRIAWTVSFEPGSCCCEVLLDADAVEIDGCDGSRIRYARDDGRELLRTFGDRDELPWWGPAIWPYTFEPSERRAGLGDVVVRDLRTGDEAARLPPDTWPVPVLRDAGAWKHHVDGLILLRGPDWLVAMHLPDPATAARPGGPFGRPGVATLR
jgi:hypothetical protein